MEAMAVVMNPAGGTSTASSLITPTAPAARRRHRRQDRQAELALAM
jgi:hypothetical protein